MSSLPNTKSTQSTAGVTSLRSRFENLAVADSSASTSHGFLSPDNSGSRPRAVSGSQPGSSNPANHLRSSSSSSDLKGTRRPPPPLPSSLGSSKPPSPSTSPLMRPSFHQSSPPSFPNMSSNNRMFIASTSPVKKSPPPHKSSAYSPTLVLPMASVGSKSVLSQARTTSMFADSSYSVTSSNVSLESLFYDDKDMNSDAESIIQRQPPPLPSRKNGKSSNLHNRDSLDSLDLNPSASSTSSSTSRIAPPRPPPRLQIPTRSQTPSEWHISGLSQTQAPPPLPARPTPTVNESSLLRRTSSRGPPISDTASLDLISSPTGTHLAFSTTERKAFGALPPPPKRHIGLGDGLPELRRQYVSDSSDDEEEEEIKVRSDLPDTSRSSRRPPYFSGHKYSDHNITIQAFHGVYAVAGHMVVIGAGHNIKAYDLSLSDNAIWSLDTKDIAPDHRSRKVTSLEFRLPLNDQDRGCLVWIGTKEGNLFEVDIRTAKLVCAKVLAHAYAVCNIFRHGHSMLTIDDNGKVLIFSTDSESEDVVLSKTQPKVMRIADKQVFVKLIGGLLWTSARETHGTMGTSRGPTVRVYDILSPGSSGKSLLPTEPVGIVTCGTALPSSPDLVYLGHEGGNVTVWSLNSSTGPECIDSIKVSMSDILCLAGVNDRLWSGARTGHIAAYDVTSTPWVMTNCWMAHNSLPVSSIFVDPWSIEKVRKLSAISVGRDEKMKFWDGLLAVDWVDQELVKQEGLYSTYRELSVLIISWNIDANKPDALYGDVDNSNFLHSVLTSAGVPDIISFGFQEVVDLESRKTAAKSVLLGGKTKTNDGSISQKVSTAYKKWHDHLVLSVRLAMSPQIPYTVIHTESLVGLYTCIFVKNSERPYMKDIHINTVKCGMGGNFGNKGAIIGRFVIDDTSLCFINCHLAAGQHQIRQRGRDVASILEEKALFPENSIVEPVAFTNGGDGSMILDHEIVFFSGDMNYRIDQRREIVIASINSGDYQTLQNHDQLIKEMKFNRGYRLRSFLEGPIRFIPTYKYDPGTDEFDTSHKRRTPAWCDRILWRSLDDARVKQTQYRRWEANISDHRPISGSFELRVKSIRHELRAAVKLQIEGMWREYEKKFLAAAKKFYVDQLLL